MSSSEPHIVGEHAAQTHFPELLAKVAAGEAVTITRHGIAVARLVPIERGETSQERRVAIDSIKTLGRDISLGEQSIRDLIQEGRR